MRQLVRVALVAVVAGGCTSVKMVQRDGCWVRRTEKPFGRVIEEVGPCARPQPQWAQDRLTRLVQECVASADFRAQARALESFTRRFPYPTPQPQKEETLRACMEEVRSGMEAERDRETMERRVVDLAGERDRLREDSARDREKLFAQVAGERDALRQGAEKDRAREQDREDKLAEWLGRSQDKLGEYLGQSQGKLAESLGQAALKPPGNATATATSTSDSKSDGKANTTSDTGATLASDSGASAPAPSASVVVPAGPPAQSAAAAPAAAAPPPGAQASGELPRRKKALRARRAASAVRPVSSDVSAAAPGPDGRRAAGDPDPKASGPGTSGPPPCAVDPPPPAR